MMKTGTQVRTLVALEEDVDGISPDIPEGTVGVVTDGDSGMIQIRIYDKWYVWYYAEELEVI